MEQLRAVALLKRRLAANCLGEARRLKMVRLDLRGSAEKKGGGRSGHHRWKKDEGSDRAARRRRVVSGKRRKGRAGLLTGGEGSLLPSIGVERRGGEWSGRGFGQRWQQLKFRKWSGTGRR
jgi:hypothetical protein